MSIDLSPVKEGQTAVVQATIKNELQQPIAGADLVSLTLWIYDKETETTINTRDGKTILGVAPLRVNGGTVNALGQLDLRLDPADNDVIDETIEGEEIHVLLIGWTWYDAGVLKYGAEELWLPVTSLKKVGTT